MEEKNFNNIADIFQARVKKKAPAHEWQDLALSIIKELNVPPFKRSSVFKACKEKDKQFILNCLNDTKELCQSKEKWKYFFKIVSNESKEKDQ
jgi:hypothetical protein